MICTKENNKTMLSKVDKKCEFCSARPFDPELKKCLLDAVCGWQIEYHYQVVLTDHTWANKLLQYDTKIWRHFILPLV